MFSRDSGYNSSSNEQVDAGLSIPFSDRLGPVCLLYYALFAAGSLVSMMISWASGPHSSFEHNGKLSYVLWAGLWTVFIAAMLISKRDRYMLKKLSLSSRRPWKHLGLGAALGGGLALLCLLLACRYDGVVIQPSGAGDRVWQFHLLTAVILYGGTELGLRLYVLERLRRSHESPRRAVLVPVLLLLPINLVKAGADFTAIANQALLGIFLSLAVYRFDAFWFAAAFTTAFNSIQNDIFSLPTFVRDSSTWFNGYYSMQHAPAQASFFYSPDFGVEGAGIMTVIYLLCIMGLILVGRKNGQ